MLFNSYEFIFIFLPVVFLGFFTIGKYSRTLGAIWLASASLMFYGWWSIKALPILVGSILVNFWFGKQLSNVEKWQYTTRKYLLWVSLAANLALLGFFKYANFFVSNINTALNAWQLQQLEFINVALPIGISFFTFTQIAYLVDSWQGRAKEPSLAHYFLFVTYFPHLIAGPVLHHNQMMPQFTNTETYNPNYNKIAVGLSIFTIGLAKKILIADPLGVYVSNFFIEVSQNTNPMFFNSWINIITYGFQIYFDFSGYTDMAIGISFMFGIRLPINFNSPYKAINIIDFWRRWHISLSDFLRDYLYIPLGGNRHGDARRYSNLLTTMLLGGFWHGASWTFVLWGGLHGIYLVINNQWRNIYGKKARFGTVGIVCSWAITFAFVNIAWVLFRSESVTIAAKIYQGLFGFNGIEIQKLSNHSVLQNIKNCSITSTSSWQYVLVILAFFIVLGFPNTNHLHDVSVNGNSFRSSFYLKSYFAPIYGIMFIVCVLKLSSKSPFLYFQF